MKKKKPKIVVLCGSSRFVDVMAVCAWLIERDENAITMGLHLLPIWYAGNIPSHLAEHEDVANKMDERHLRKIDLASEIFVVNREHYVGESTANEVEYGRKKEIIIRWYTDDIIGFQVEKMIHAFLSKRGA